MPTSAATARPGQNRLLVALPADQLEPLRRHLEPVALGLKEVVYAPNEPIRDVYFPLTGAFSLLTVMADGTEVEVATVGNEGMVGLPVFLGADSMPGRCFSQIPGEALRMPADRFRDAVRRNGAFAAVLHRYVQALFNQVAQTAACNRVHPIEERCARWLLMTHDRAGADRFPLTHEFLSQMLGVRRATVTVVAGMLQRAGLINYRRGVVTVADRPGLEAASCECYRFIRDEFDRLLG
jgi:CRP-like cAMP-binding protein